MMQAGWGMLHSSKKKKKKKKKKKQILILPFGEVYSRNDLKVSIHLTDEKYCSCNIFKNNH